MSNKDEARQVSEEETREILSIAQKCLSLDGDLVEFGCYRGDTSLLLKKIVEEHNRSSQEEVKLWIYDSFEGLPEKSLEDESVAGAQFKKGELYVSKREVRERFLKAGLKVPVIKKGFFEELDSNDVPTSISFGFLDGDLYSSIISSLNLIKARMLVRGVIIVHDYGRPELPGVTKAVEEFLANSRQKMCQKGSLAIIEF